MKKRIILSAKHISKIYSVPSCLRYLCVLASQIACGAQTQSEERHGDTEGVFDEE